MIGEQNMNRLPEGWKWMKLGEVCEIISGRNQSKVLHPKGKYPIYGSSGMFGLSNEYLCNEGTTIVGRKGTINNPLFVTTKFWNVDTAFGLSPNKCYNNKLFFYFCKSFDFKSLDKSTTIPSLAKRDLLNIDIPLPPETIQQRIVSKIEELFSEIDKGVEQLKTARQQLKNYRQAVLKWAFEGRLTEKWREENRSRVCDPSSPQELTLLVAEEEKVYETKSDLPEGWKIKTIGEVFEVFIGSTPKRNQPEYWNGNVNWVSSGEVAFCNITNTKETITEAGLKSTSCKVHPVGTVIMAMIGEGKTRGQVAILKTESAHNQNTAAIRINAEVYLSELLYHYLVLTYNDNRKVGSGNNQKALNKERVSSINIPLVPIKEQNQILLEIESRLSVADKMEESISQSLQQADVLRQSILKKAFEGKLVQTETEPVMKVIVKEIPNERKILAGKIIHLLHNNPRFGSTRFQKVLFVTEHFAEMEYETHYLQETAGPYDRDFTVAFKKEMREKDWFDEETVRGGGTRFLVGKNVGSLITDYPKYFRGKGEQIRFVLELMKDCDTHEAELIATLYAVWNNRLIQKKPVDIALLTEDFFRWSVKKKEVFLEQEIKERYEWMNQVGLIPTGFGKVV